MSKGFYLGMFIIPIWQIYWYENQYWYINIVEMCKSDPKPIRSDRIFSDFGSSKIISDWIKLFCSRIGLEPDFQLLKLEKESSSVKVDASGLVFWSS